MLPLAPVIQTGLVVLEVPSVSTVVVLLQIYLPFCHVGGLVFQPVVGATVAESLIAYSTSTNFMALLTFVFKSSVISINSFFAVFIALFVNPIEAKSSVAKLIALVISPVLTIPAFALAITLSLLTSKSAVVTSPCLACAYTLASLALFAISIASARFFNFAE